MISRLAMPGRLIVDSWLRSQSSLNRRTHPKLKSSSRAVPKKIFKDGGSIILLILGGEQTSRLSIFLDFGKSRPLLPVACVCIWNRNGMVSRNSATLSGWGGTEWKHHRFLGCYCRLFTKIGTHENYPPYSKHLGLKIGWWLYSHTVAVNKKLTLCFRTTIIPT